MLVLIPVWKVASLCRRRFDFGKICRQQIPKFAAGKSLEHAAAAVPRKKFAAAATEMNGPNISICLLVILL